MTSAGSVHVALLRGINVGPAKRVAMADLRAAVAGCGYGDVRTLLNSGNVVFTAPGPLPADVAGALEAAVRERTGVQATVTVLTAAEVALAVEQDPLRAGVTDLGRLLHAVPADAGARADLAGLGTQTWGEDRFALGERVGYLWFAEGVLASPLAKALARRLGDRVTSRNAATMDRLLALVRASPGSP